MHWEYRYVAVQPGVTDDFAYLRTVLEDHWEPYAVTWEGSYHIHHLRRKTADK